MNNNSAIHAVLLTGGSAFGLAAADGVVQALEADGIGYQVGDLGAEARGRVRRQLLRRRGEDGSQAQIIRTSCGCLDCFIGRACGDADD